jgi:glyoxylase-like metal-dependent hydrolase (beta-lactamase superfamily II)
MIVKGLTVGLLQENCYILGCEQTRRGVIIDPGDNPRAILKIVSQQKLTIEKILLTHAHFDHIMALEAVKNSTNAPYLMHPADLPILRDAPARVQLWLDSEMDPLPEPDDFLEHGQRVTFGNEQMEVRFTPGHAPGHVIFVHHAGRQIFGGDTLFQGSIGRYDLPLADGPTLFRSIREQIFTLPDDYVVYPGHGPATTIGEERANNPFVGEVALHTQ